MRVRRSVVLSSGRPADSSESLETSSSTDVRRYTHTLCSCTILSHSGVITAPPPRASIMPPVSRISFSVSFSSILNSASPRSAKISATVHPQRASISASRSIKGQQSNSESFLPTLLLPHPINPVNDIIIRKAITEDRHHQVRCRLDLQHLSCQSHLPDFLAQPPQLARCRPLVCAKALQTSQTSHPLHSLSYP